MAGSVHCVLSFSRKNKSGNGKERGKKGKDLFSFFVTMFRFPPRLCNFKHTNLRFHLIYPPSKTTSESHYEMLTFKPACKIIFDDSVPTIICRIIFYLNIIKVLRFLFAYQWTIHWQFSVNLLVVCKFQVNNSLSSDKSIEILSFSNTVVFSENKCNEFYQEDYKAVPILVDHFISNPEISHFGP